MKIREILEIIIAYKTPDVEFIEAISIRFSNLWQVLSYASQTEWHALPFQKLSVIGSSSSRGHEKSSSERESLDSPFCFIISSYFLIRLFNRRIVRCKIRIFFRLFSKAFLAIKKYLIASSCDLRCSAVTSPMYLTHFLALLSEERNKITIALI